MKVIFNGKNNRYSDVDFEIYIPENFNLDIKTTGGNTELQTELTGDVRIESGGGNVELAEITGDVTLSTGGGNITTEIIYGNLELETGGGNCTIGDVTRDVSVITGGGNLSVGKVEQSNTRNRRQQRWIARLLCYSVGSKGRHGFEGWWVRQRSDRRGTVCVEINPALQTLIKSDRQYNAYHSEDAKANVETRLLARGWKQMNVQIFIALSEKAMAMYLQCMC